MAIFSSITWKRAVEAMAKVRSGVTKPAATVRTASINSLATSTSMSPMPGSSANTGCRPPSALQGCGQIST